MQEQTELGRFGATIALRQAEAESGKGGELGENGSNNDV